MTEEFKKHASSVIDGAVLSEKSRLMNLVGEAWSEGKKQAEVDRVSMIVGEALSRLCHNDVFCAECKWFDKDSSCAGTGSCHNPKFGDGWGNYPPPGVYEAFYCADGKRKEP